MLDSLIGGRLFNIILVFCRVGSALMILPGFSESYVSARVRLLFGLAVAFILAPVVAAQLPAQPRTVPDLMILLGTEIFVGIFIGTLAKLAMSSLELAGFIISQATGLSNAQVYNPALATQETLPGALISMVALAMIFVTDMHHMMLAAIADSYTVFVPGRPLPLGDFADTVTRLTATSFTIGAQMSAPFLVVGIMLNLALALVGRLAPQLQITSVAMSVQIVVGLLLLVFVMSAMMLYWLSSFEANLHGLLASGP